MPKKYSLLFVNAGKEFSMPTWSVGKHEELLEEMIEFDEQLKLKIITQRDYTRKYHTLLILKSLHEIDPKVTEKDLNALHPDDFLELCLTVYNEGKKGIEVNNNVDFQKGEKKSPIP
jgi:hypothetical protein